MDNIEDINRELNERLRRADVDGHADDWLQRLASHPRRPMRGKRRAPVSPDAPAANAGFRQQ